MPDDRSMACLFSARVITACGEPAGLDDTLHPLELPAVSRAVEKRRRDFVAGRTCARRALRKLGFDDVAIPVGEKREPLWPEGVVGSISHTSGFCGVAVARRSDVKGLGFDVECVVDVKLELRSHIASEVELENLHRAVGGERARALALAFSAKEAFFKYQFPLNQQWLGLLDVEIRADTGGFLVVPNRDVANVCVQGAMIRGSYKFFEGYVLTAIEVTA